MQYVNLNLKKMDIVLLPYNQIEAEIYLLEDEDRAEFLETLGSVIHTDFEKGLIRAKCIAYDDYIQFNGENWCKRSK